MIAVGMNPPATIFAAVGFAVVDTGRIRGSRANIE